MSRRPPTPIIRRPLRMEIPKARLKDLMSRAKVNAKWIAMHHGKKMGGVGPTAICSWIRPSGTKSTEYFYIDALIEVLENRIKQLERGQAQEITRIKDGRTIIPKEKVKFYCKNCGIQVQQLEARIDLRPNELHWWMGKSMKAAPAQELERFFEEVKKLTPNIEEKWQASLIGQTAGHSPLAGS